MIVRRFLAWAKIAPACARAEATQALARAFLFAQMDENDRYEAEVALTVMLDDPSPLVHRAMAEAVASAIDAPHHLITGIVALGGEAAALVLARTRLLSEAELVDATALGDERAQIAIASRDPLAAPVAAAIGEVGSLTACMALADNFSADIAAPTYLRMLDRFGADGRLRETMLARPALPPGVRERLMALVSDVLRELAVGRGWLGTERAAILIRDAEETGALAIAADPRLDLREAIACLRARQRLTPAFVVQALLSGETDVVVAALADLARTPPAKVAAFLREMRWSPLSAVLKRAGMPAWLVPLFPVALAEMRDAAIKAAGATPATALRLALRRIIARIEAGGGRDEASRRLVAYLRRFEMNAARGEARALAEAMIVLDLDEADEARPAMLAGHEGAPPALLEHDQDNIAEMDQDFGEPVDLDDETIDLELEAVDLDLEATAVSRAA